MAAATEQDYYGVLGVPRTASQDEIRKAYLKLAHRYHPDKTGGDKTAEEKLKHINEAYDTLKNADKRKQYDDSLRAAQFSGFGGAEPAGGPGTAYDYEFGSFGGESSFEDMLGSLFGRHGARAPRARAGNDVETSITVTLNEIAKGAQKRLRVPHRDTCGTCGGSGAAPGSQPQTCPVCGGKGRVERAGGAFNLTQTCSRCGGTGKIITKPCPRCKGSGTETTERELSVRIPAGIESGAQLRIAGEGEPGVNGGPRGDLYIRINMAPHEFFTREGDNVVCEAPVPFTTAALGGKVRVPTLQGVAELNVPAGTQNGTMLRMRGLGIARSHGAKGDELVRVLVEVPARLTREQQEIIRKMSETGDGQMYPKSTSFARRIGGTGR
jgi:molecular chaperone DnaJ